jgi:hypothetical protein
MFWFTLTSTKATVETELFEAATPEDTIGDALGYLNWQQR